MKKISNFHAAALFMSLSGVAGACTTTKPTEDIEEEEVGKVEQPLDPEAGGQAVIAPCTVLGRLPDRVTRFARRVCPRPWRAIDRTRPAPVDSIVTSDAAPFRMRTFFTRLPTSSRAPPGSGSSASIGFDLPVAKAVALDVRIEDLQ